MAGMSDFLSYIDAKKEVITMVSDSVWEYAELSLKEYKSAELYCKVLAGEGFLVEKDVCGIKTAFKATFGSGRPVIGILAEFDALAGLSQKAGVHFREELTPGGNGHGCGHNMLGAGALAAALGVQAYLKDKEGRGTIVLYGCPGEEGGAAKAFMARDGEFKDLDAALTWHPGDINNVNTLSCNSSIQVEYTFKGVAAHAAKAEFGRSALDASEIMNIGVQYIREHIADSDRVHYAYTDAGGVSPNVVQPAAKVLYMVRSNNVKNALKLLARIDKIAAGAAMMTETSMTRKFIDGTSDVVSNFTLGNMLYEEYKKIGVPSYTQEENNFAAAMIQSYESPQTDLPGREFIFDMETEDFVRRNSNNGKKPLNDFLIPYKPVDSMTMGSTDVGDVSWLTPTAQIHVVTTASNAPGHSWQNVSCAKTSIAHKAVLHAGKVLAAGAVKLYENPELLKAAMDEFKKKTQEGYYCPVPQEAIAVAL